MNLSPPLPRHSLRNNVFDLLYQRIIAGQIRPGEWLRQEEIASQLGVSMTPVREALDLLVAAGLAERVPYRGVRVLQLTQDEMLEAYGLRLLLESIVARLAAGRATSEQVQQARELLDQMGHLVRLEDVPRLRQASRRFHATIVAMSGSPLLSRLYEIVTNRFPDWMLYEAMFRHPDALNESLQRDQNEHQALLEAIARHDPEAAVCAAQRHILSLGNDLHDYLNIPRPHLDEKERLFLACDPPRPEFPP